MRPTNPHTRRLTALILLSTVAVGTAFGTTTAFADPAPETDAVGIHYVRTELTQPGSAQVLYEKIQRAAREVCHQPDMRQLHRYSQFKQCYAQAVDSAVSQINASALTALHHSRTQRSAAG